MILLGFLGPDISDMATSETSAFCAQKSRDFQDPPLPMALPLPRPSYRTI